MIVSMFLCVPHAADEVEAEMESSTVRIIYFIPNDRAAEPDIDNRLDTLMKNAKNFYAAQLEAHGFSRKTFRFEVDKNGNAVVHHIRGKFNNAYYQDPATGSWVVWNEIEEHFDMSKNIYVLALGISVPYLVSGGINHIIGLGSGDTLSGRVLLPASNLSIGVTVHELGHAFGLMHDSRSHAKNIYASPISGDLMTTSFCAAEWLDVHRYFNPTQKAFNQNTSFDMLTPTLASPPADIRLRFEVTDPDGLHQAQLFKAFGEDPSIIDCQSLSGTHAIIESITNELPLTSTVILRVMDVHGNFSEKAFNLDITDLLLPPETILIPDPNLATVVRETLDLASGDAITWWDMRKLTTLMASDREIKNITGLEHATRLRYLHLINNKIQDITPLTELEHLYWLDLRYNQISQIPSLNKLIRLRILELGFNQIRDVNPFTELPILKVLDLSHNQISDVRPLANLVNLNQLHLVLNPIKNRKPLFELLRKNPDIKIYLKNILEPLPVTLSHFRASHTDIGVILNWITESEVNNAGFYIYRRTKDGEFKVVNPQIIQGAGTTGQRNEYTWTDTTANPNTVYYYRIEDVSHAGVRQQLATVRLRGLVSATGKLMTRWANLKHHR